MWFSGLTGKLLAVTLRYAFMRCVIIYTVYIGNTAVCVYFVALTIQ